jgi:hypothetical protein
MARQNFIKAKELDKKFGEGRIFRSIWTSLVHTSLAVTREG